MPQWPSHVKFAAMYTYDVSVSTNTRHFIEHDDRRQSTVIYKRSSSTDIKPPVAIKRITETSHPAFEQFGLFASKKIASNTHIMDYLGASTPQIQY
jgi:hypothetical protein